jgi:ABC-type transport system involved in cytochrome c biogenesis permease subunit
MNILTVILRFVLLLTASATSRLRPTDDGERGDVPGWVMITLMSAVLVAALLAIAGPALEGLFNQAIDQVSP